MPLLPAPFLFRLTYTCPHVKNMPREDDDRLLDLPSHCRSDNLPELSDRKNFADVRLAWNELGLGFQVEVKGKDQPITGDASRPRSSDGAFLWIDTRDTRTIHRASRYCHQFCFLPTGGGPERDLPVVNQLTIHRAMADAPLAQPEQIPFLSKSTKSGYVLEAFLPAAALSGFDPENNPRLGFFWWVHDLELGSQTLGLGNEFPFWEDPSLWSVLELVRV